MTRGLTAGMLTQIGNPRLVPRTLVHFGFDSGSIRLCDDLRDIPFDGDTYTGSGDLGSVSAIKESAALSPKGLEFNISGIDGATWITEAITEHYQGRACEVWRAILNLTTHALIADPIKTFGGKINQMVIVDTGATASVKISAENDLVSLTRPNEIRFITDQDQQNEFTGDLGHEFVTLMQGTIVVWGRAKLEKGIVSNPGGGTEVAAPTPQAVDIPDVGGAGGPDIEPDAPVGEGFADPTAPGASDIPSVA